MLRRQHCASQCRNHLQTMLAPVLAVEGDLLWRWMENKEQLCKLYGVTLWEMPFPFPTGKCAGRRFQRGLGSVTPLGADTMPRPWLPAKPCCLGAQPTQDALEEPGKRAPSWASGPSPAYCHSPPLMYPPGPTLNMLMLIASLSCSEPFHNFLYCPQGRVQAPHTGL